MQNQLKRFKCFVLNDNDNDFDKPGWFSFINSFLGVQKYIEKERSVDIVLKLQSMSFTIYSPQSPTHPKSTLNKAIEHLKKRAQDYDIFVLDLDLSNGNFIDASEFVKQSSFQDIGEELRDHLSSYEENILRLYRHITECKKTNLKSGFFAGLECFRVIGYGDALKIVFSGSDKTSQLFEYIDILRDVFAGRLDDIIFYREDKGNARKEDVTKVKECLDAYLLKRQVEIVERQNPDLRGILYEALESSEWDELLIPDNGDPNNCREFWSLHSLFPKQVNSIIDDSDIDDARKYIAAILETDWRQQFKYLVNHPYTVGENDSERKCSFATKILEALEFKVVGGFEGKVIYQKLTDQNCFCTSAPFTRLNQLRDSLVNEAISFFSKEVPLYDRDRHESKKMDLGYWHQELRSYAENFGILPEDLKYLAQIAEHNKRHLLNSGAINVDDVGVYLTVKDDSDEHDGIASELSFIWIYTEQAIPEKLTNSKLSEKFIIAKQSPFTLEDGGIGDAIRIVCFRYHGRLELQAGKNLFTSSKYESKFIELEDSIDEGLTQFRAIISKPKALEKRE